jgi:hypothetical protein
MGKQLTVEQRQVLAALRQAARDMGVPARELADMVRAERVMMEAEAPVITARPTSAPEAPDSIRKQADKVSEKFGTFRADELKRKRAQNWRNIAGQDKAVIAARKIFRAIPSTTNVIVSTRIGWEIVTISRAERAENVETIRKQLARAEAIESTALDARAQAEAEAERRTILKRVPRENSEAVKRASSVADKASTRVMKLRKRLSHASSKHVALGLTSERVGEIRVSLRPQFMANRTAKIVRDLPTREDVHPFRYELKLRHGARVPFGFISQPEAEYLRYLAEAEAEAIRERAREIAAERQAEAERARIALWEAEQLQAREAQELTRSAYKQRRAMAQRERRRSAKLRRH